MLTERGGGGRAVHHAAVTGRVKPFISGSEDLGARLAAFHIISWQLIKAEEQKRVTERRRHARGRWEVNHVHSRAHLAILLC